jgi:LPS export ABC transporter permease LptG/LPS export ABC transporter permease LptF
MRRLDKLLYLAIIPPVLISLVVLTFVVFVREFGRFAELLITKNASLEAILIIASTIAPRILIFSLPLSFLIGTLIGLGGLAGECQITALRACGVPLRRMLCPVLVIALAVGLAAGIMSVIVLPETNDILSNLRDLISVRQATSEIVPRVFNEDFPNIVFYLDDLAVDRQHWDRVFLADNSVPQSPRIVLAREGTWVTDSGGSRLQLHLKQGTIYEVNKQEPNKDNVSVFATTDIPIDLNRGGTSPGAKGSARKRPPSQTTGELWRGTAGTQPEQRRSEMIELHRRLALPCSVFGFALVGLSLGVCTRRGGRTSGSVLGLVIVISYYILFMNGIHLAEVGKLRPWLGLWGADIVLIAFGFILLAGAEKNRWITRGYDSWRWRGRLEEFVVRIHMGLLRTAMQKLDDVAFSSTSRIARFRFPKVLDSYISRGFLVYFLWSNLVCYLLFVLFTLFDLLEEIIRNHVAFTVLVKYFVFLTPHILLFVVPMSVLLAILIEFGVLEKASEVTAMKAGGWSLYRIALPVLLISGFLSANIYVMQDYILPYANIQQDLLRNQIKGRPPQTISSKTRKWIFGEKDRIFNYDHFDSARDLFWGLNIYEVDINRLVIKRRIYAVKATINGPGAWVLENGWIRDFSSERSSFTPFDTSTFNFPEPAAYFRKEIFEPKDSSKFTYLELKQYINYLKQSGYNATDLQVELNKKISFPLSCFVMALLGIPFSFSTGKKGAFFGITASVAIAISYWGVFSVFEQMGAYGLLAPGLSAWAPNLLFGAGGLALLFTIRT